jgi:hypothetical protein
VSLQKEKAKKKTIANQGKKGDDHVVLTAG